MTQAPIEDGDSIEEIYLDRNTVYGNRRNPYDIDLMRGIIINVRNGETIKDSQNVLISMLEKLLSKSSVEEKKRILTEKCLQKRKVFYVQMYRNP